MINREPIDIIVEEILPKYSDELLADIVCRITNKKSTIREAVLREMGLRCATEYKRRKMFLGIPKAK